MAIVIGVRFAKNSKIYYFDPSDVWPAIGDGVICDTSRGPEYGVVAASAREVDDDMLQLPLRKVISMATEADVERVKANEKLGREAMLTCKDKIVEHKLEMKLIDVEVAFDNSKMVFYFTANGRVDFRELVKDLASIFKTRIELRQIGVRDEAKLLGGLGPCGRPICCGSFLSNFQPVSIKMAKEQNLSLNPTKISGLCGRLMCCLKYEEDYYEMMTKRLPRAGRDIMTPDGLGTVVDIDVLREKVKARIQLPDNTFDVRTYEYADCSRPEPGVRAAADAARAAAAAAAPAPAAEPERSARTRGRRLEPDRPAADKQEPEQKPRRDRRRNKPAEAEDEAAVNVVSVPETDFKPEDTAIDVADVDFDDDMIDVGAEEDIDEELRAERELLAIAHAQNAAAEARFADMQPDETTDEKADEPAADEPAEPAASVSTNAGLDYESIVDTVDAIVEETDTETVDLDEGDAAESDSGEEAASTEPDADNAAEPEAPADGE